MARSTPARDRNEAPGFFKIGMLVTVRESLGAELWRIVDLVGTIAQLKPISLGATAQQSPVRELRRYRIQTTDQVFRNEELVRVRKVANPRAEDLYEYEIELTGGGVLTVREHELTVHVGSEAPDPLAQVINLDGAPAEVASARRVLLDAYFKSTSRSLGIVGYNGARMLPIPHQINAARYALLHGRARFLLADEVGLGKTVEAGLIVSTLRKYFPEWKVGFFVPESITVQWAFEMYGKFGKAIYRIDEDMEWDEDDDDPGLIAPHARALDWGKRPAPEIIVVDEAHHILRDPALYAALMGLSRRAHAVLLLTATPTSEDGANLLRLLQLADPEAFGKMTSPSVLEGLLARQAGVESFLAALRDVAVGAQDLRAAWSSLEFEDAEIESTLMALIVDPTDLLTRHKLAALVTDRYFPGARILRYQRKFLALDNAMAERVEEPIEYRPSPEEAKVRELAIEWLGLVAANHLEGDPEWQAAASVLVQAAHSSPIAVENWLQARAGGMEPPEGVSADPVRRHRLVIEGLPKLKGEEELLEKLLQRAKAWSREARAVDMKGRALARLPRYLALVEQLKALLEDDGQRRAIVFTSFEQNVKPLYLLLRKALGEDIDVFSISADVEWHERERSAFAFQECRGSAVLVSDELGGEGRNFQFVDALFHFDLPLAPWILEQRIGRLDRVGRSEELDIDSQVLVAPGHLDEAVYEFHRDGVGVFNESLAPVEDLIESVTGTMVRTLIRDGEDGVLDLVSRVSDQLEERRAREERDLVRRSDTGVETVKALVPLLDDRAELTELKRGVLHYTRLLGSVVDDAGGKVTLTVGSHHPLHAVTGVLSEMQGHFDRAQAVLHERLEFFSPGHPFVRALARGALQESPDRAAFLSRPGLPFGALVVSFRVQLPQGFLEAIRNLPEDVQPAILCCVGQHFGTRIHAVVIDFEGREVADPAQRDLFLAPFTREDHSQDRGAGIYDYLPGDWDAVCTRAVEAARGRVAEYASELLDTHRAKLEALLAEVLTRQFGVEFALASQIDALLFEMEPLTVELDSVMVLFPEKG